MSIINLTENIRDIDPNDYFDNENSMFIRMKENIQKISLILLKPMELKDKILVGHLSRENTKLKRLLNIEPIWAN